MPGKLHPFWTYFGGKYRLGIKYPPPTYNTIIEPFAGAAGYALNYSERNVILCDLNPIIAGIWKYLITAKSEEGACWLPFKPFYLAKGNESVSGCKISREMIWERTK